MLYIDLPAEADLITLAAERADACVSIYVPTTPLTQDIGQSRLTLKNLAKQAEEQLHAAAFDKRRLALVADHIEHLEADEDFWAHQATSLAVLATPDRIVTYRLPTTLKPMVEVSDRFHVKPLFRALAFPDVAFVLSLSENHARLVEIPAEGAAQTIKVPDMPRKMDEAGTRSKHRNTAPGGRFEGSKGEEFHRRAYSRQIDAALRPVLAGRRTPLILACVAEFEQIYRTVNSYPHLAGEAVRGNPDHLTDGALAEAARPILRNTHAAAVAHERELYGHRGQSGRASSDLSTIAHAAVAGAVEMLMVDIDAVTLGTYDDTTGKLSLSAGPAGKGTYDVTDAIAAVVLRNGGRVVGVRKADLPDQNSPVAATYRYAFTG
jgi:hypothetical protein